MFYILAIVLIVAFYSIESTYHTAKIMQRATPDEPLATYPRIVYKTFHPRS